MKKLFLSFLLSLFIILLFTACDNSQIDTNNSEFINEEQSTLYVLKTYSLTDEYGNAGTYTEINGKYNKGDAVEVEATVNTGYNFEGWYINDIRVSDKLLYSFTMKEENLNLEARWSYYTVTVNSDTDEQGTAGTFTKKVDEKISIGEIVTLNATVNKGFNFEGWYIGQNCISHDFEYIFTMKNKNMDIEAVYSYYSITVESRSDQQGLAGTYPQKNNEKISAGETVTLTATVADGYNFEGWYINGVCVCSDLTYQFVMEKVNKKIRVEYSYYTLTTDGYILKYSYRESLADIVGTFTEYNEKKVSAGEIITLVATVGDGYTFMGWYIGNICVSEDLEYSYTMTKKNVELDARFVYYTISTKALLDCGHYAKAFEDNMGSYTQYDKEKIRVGDTVTLTATVKTGYKFVGWECRNTIVCEDLIYTFVMGTTDETYEAIFEEL